MHGLRAQTKRQLGLFLLLPFQCRRCELPLQLSLALAHDDSREPCPDVLVGPGGDLKTISSQETGQRKPAYRNIVVTTGTKKDNKPTKTTGKTTISVTLYPRSPGCCGRTIYLCAVCHANPRFPSISLLLTVIFPDLWLCFTPSLEAPHFPGPPGEWDQDGSRDHQDVSPKVWFWLYQNMQLRVSSATHQQAG